MRGTSIAAALAASLFALTAVACDDDDDPTGPTTGAVEVQVTTTGTGTDADGYSVSVDGGTGVPVAVNGTVVIPGIQSGTRSVQLGGVDPACAVQGSNPASVTVVAGDTASASFTVECTTPVTGTIRVTTTTTGESLDEDGYLVDTDGDTLEIELNDTVAFEGLSPGDYPVTISDVEANCTVADTTTQDVTLAGEDTAEVDFSISCVAPATASNISAIRSGGSTLSVASSRQLQQLLALSES